MEHGNDSWPVVPEEEVFPEVAAVLKPEECVYWQGKPVSGPRLSSITAGLLFLGLFMWVTGYHATLTAVWQSRSFLELLPALAVTITFIGVILVVNRRRTRSLRYAVTSQRALRLNRGRIMQQAGPGELTLQNVHTGTGGVGTVRWHNAAEFGRDNWIQGFFHIRNARSIYQMLQQWQKAWQQQSNTLAESSSEAYRQHRDNPANATETASHAADKSPLTPAAAQHIAHAEYGFSLEVPADWDVSVAQHYEGPLKLLGITLLKRVIRPGPARAYSPGDRHPWNRLIIRGGASAGLNISIYPPGSATPDAGHELDDRWSKVLGVTVSSVERDINIAGFQGFAAVRELPAGSNAIGFGYLPAAVLSRQWWLTGHDLQLEILGIAPAGSQTLQETVDRVVHSLKPLQTRAGAA
ncbi:MAG: hypothetical protein RIC38_03990 [Chromatocurvus sp.]